MTSHKSTRTSSRLLVRPLRSPYRWAGAILLVVAAAVHVPLIGEHLEEAPYVGVLFIALTTVCLVLAAVLVVADASVVWWASGVTSSLAVLAFLISRTVGLPDLGDDIGNWTEPLGFPALVSEALVSVAAVLALRRSRHLSRRNPS